MSRTGDSPVARLASGRRLAYLLCFAGALWLLIGSLWVGGSVLRAPVAQASSCRDTKVLPASGSVGTMVTATIWVFCALPQPLKDPITVYLTPGANTGAVCIDTTLQHVRVETVNLNGGDMFSVTFAWPAAANTPGAWSICSKDANGVQITYWDTPPFKFIAPTPTPRPVPTATPQPTPTSTPIPTATDVPTDVPTSTPGTVAPVAISHDQPPDYTLLVVGGGGMLMLMVAGAIFFPLRKRWHGLGEKIPHLSPSPPDASAESEQP